MLKLIVLAVVCLFCLSDQQPRKESYKKDLKTVDPIAGYYATKGKSGGGSEYEGLAHVQKVNQVYVVTL